MRSRKNFLSNILSKLSGSRDATIVIGGAPGSGKSWLLEELSKALEPQHCLHLRAHRSESDWPLSGAMLLLSNLSLSQPINLDRFLPQFPEQHIDTFAVARYLQRVLPEYLEAGTVVLVDDLDLMDPASLKIIGFLANTMRGIRTRFVGTISGDSVPDELCAMNFMNILPLTRNESFELARAHAGPAADTAVLRFVSARGHGIPGEILAQLESLGRGQRNGQLPLNLPLSPSKRYLAQLASMRDSLSPSQIKILQLTAASPLCERNTLLDYAINPADLDELTRRGFLEPYGGGLAFSDGALRSAVYWSLGSEQRAELHERLHTRSSLSSLKLFHLSFMACDRVSSAALLAESRHLLAQGLNAAAVEVAERALNLETSDPQIPLLLSAFANELFEAAELDMSRRYLSFAQQLSPEADTELALTTLQVKLAATEGSPTPKLDIPALMLKHERHRPIPCGRLFAVYSCAHALHENLVAAREAMEVADSLLSGANKQERIPLEQAAIFVAALEIDHEALLRKHQQVLGMPDEATPLEIWQSLAIALLTIGYHQEAREILTRINPLTPEPSPLVQRLTCLLTAANAIQNENVPRALNLVERWIAMDSPVLMEPTPQLIQAWYWMIKDRQDMAEVFFENMQPQSLGEMSPKLLGRISMLSGDQALMTGQLQRAVEEYRATLRSYQGVADIRFVRTTAHLIEALVLLGRSDQAVSEYRERQQLMSQVPGRRAKLTMRFAQALVLDGDAAISRFHTLLSEWMPSDSSFELARIRHALGHRLQAMEQHEAAREQLLAARNLYRSLGARAWANNIDSALTARAPLSSSLAPVDFSQEEFQVVRMIHEGLTNKAIAKQLYISVSAVEARLTKLYRRTGAKNRQQLATRFSDLQASAL